MGNKKTSSDWKNIARVTLKKHSSVVVLLAIVILASCISDVFLTKNNILNVLRQITANGILSIGLLMVIMTGGMDISIGSLVGVTSVFFVSKCCVIPYLQFPASRSAAHNQAADFVRFSPFSEIGRASCRERV